MLVANSAANGPSPAGNANVPEPRQRGASAGARPPALSRQRARASSGDMENQPRAANSLLLLPTRTRSSAIAGKPPLGPSNPATVARAGTHGGNASSSSSTASGAAGGAAAAARVVKRARSLSLPLDWEERERLQQSRAVATSAAAALPFTQNTSLHADPAHLASSSPPSSPLSNSTTSSTSVPYQTGASRLPLSGSMRESLLVASTAVAAVPKTTSPFSCCGPLGTAPACAADAASGATPSGGPLHVCADNADEARTASLAQDPAREAGDPQPCIICYGGFSAKRPPVRIPCESNCNDAPVHAKCIFEWKETKRPFTLSPSSCPLCRGALSEMDYTPPDPLHTASLVRFSYRKSFVSRPVPRTAGMVRCYIRAVREDTVLFGKSIRYEMYLQAPPKVRYPHGDLPTSSSPVVGDVLLMVARKRSLKQGSCFNSIVDMSLDQAGEDFDRKGANFVGCVKSSFSGLEHTVLAPFSTQPSTASSESHRSQRQHRSGAPGFLELGSVRYTQNRIGRSVGPRRMQVCVPMVGAAAASSMDDVMDEHLDIAEETAAAKAAAADHELPPLISSSFANMNVLEEDDDDDDEEEEERPWATNVYRPVKSADTMRQTLRRGQTGVVNSDALLFGSNKQPYWLDSIQAYSLDFAGRVTLPSNKNFQLCLQGEPSPGTTIPEPDGSNEITLQFGKVHEGAVEVYTLDLQWPLSPVQAFGICLTASIQKICCA
ncbi:Tubby protein-like [Hondaea fermentalgiana]|uniref:Tubby protein-like n=1 Tax=Hondaea fermentalgiana TaxID=2315210 RepID=A0A2R5GAN8_9STRA|nr:Tubby protein-like [Hondaea fermentalgiana]|eukprot:GBG28082.1 Tubby protein-like [Hondaea fermentalgiana]